MTGDGHGRKAGRPGREARGETSSTAGFLEQVYRVIAQHDVSSAFGVEALAAALAISRATLYRRLAATAHHPVMELIWRHRLERAALWLTETDASVATVARHAGFKSVAHFCNRFRDRFGVTPSAYRLGGGNPAGDRNLTA